MFVSLFCLLKQGLIESGMFFHVLFPISVVEMLIEMVVINFIEDMFRKNKIN